MKNIARLIVAIVFVVCSTGCGDDFLKKTETADALAEKIDHVTVRIRRDLIEMAGSSRKLFENPSPYEDGLYPDRTYVFFNDVMYQNPEDDGNGQILYTGYVPVTDREKKKVKVMEHLVPELKKLTETSEFSDFIAQAYLITHDSMVVFYPFSDLAGYIPPRRDMRSRGGWKKISPENNPERKHFWTPPYADTVGRGLMVDVCFPVYNGDALEAFTGLDITLETIKEKFLKDMEEKILLIDGKSSQLFAMTDPCADLLGVENIQAFKYLEMIENTGARNPAMPDDLVLEETTSPTLKNLWRRLRTASDFTMEIENREHRVHARSLAETGWILVLME